ncbi:MAG: hypothetical protein HOQ22_07820, partial [Nocardioidaceae bacterium]|nr:hypothetical protein [Nocardioidaceae bacterium]
MTQATPLGGGRPLRTLLAEQRVLAVVRAPQLPDPVALCAALAAGGIRVVELTFTTPGVEKHLAAATEHAGDDVVVGAGTVLGADQATAAVQAGARFLVTPAVGRFAE